MDEIKRLKNSSTKILRKLTQLRNIKTAKLKSSDLIYILMRSQKHYKESEYLKYLQADKNNERKSKINIIRKNIIELGMLLDKRDRDILEKD